MIQEGRYTVKIEEHDIRSSLSGSEFVSLLVHVDGDPISVPIWLTAKNTKGARAQLAACGFDMDKDDLWKLAEQPNYLAGREITIDVAEKEYNGNKSMKAQIVLGAVDKARVEKIQKRLRGKGNGGPPEADEEPQYNDDDIPF